jgi:hypothetical protein
MMAGSCLCRSRQKAERCSFRATSEGECHEIQTEATTIRSPLLNLPNVEHLNWEWQIREEHSAIARHAFELFETLAL